jgi:hypothetical protein
LLTGTEIKPVVEVALLKRRVLVFQNMPLAKFEALKIVFDASLHGSNICFYCELHTEEIVEQIQTPHLCSLYGLFTQTVIFSVGCNSRIRHHTKNRILPIFCAMSDAAVASNTENHVHVNRPLWTPPLLPLLPCRQADKSQYYKRTHECIPVLL